MFVLSASLSHAGPPPLELIGSEATPEAPVACELLIADHDAEGTRWSFRLSLSAPDGRGRSTVQRVTAGIPRGHLPPSSPIARVVELDPRLRFVDDRNGEPSWAFVRPSAVDWSRWPLILDFVAPRPDAPEDLGRYRVTVRDGAPREAWGSCILGLIGPGGVGGCTMIAQSRGTCLSDYEARHGLGPGRRTTR